MADNNPFEAYEEQQKAREQAKLEEKKLQNALRVILTTEDGRRVLSWVMALTGMGGSVSSTDALRMALASGRRDVGVEIYSTLRRLCPEALVLLTNEALKNG